MAVLAAVVTAALHRAEEESFLRLLPGLEPAWLLAAAALQGGTYLLQAAVWRLTAAAGGRAPRVADAVRLAFAKLFLDQAVPSLGLSGNALVARALAALGVPADVVTAAVVVDLAAYYAAYAACLAIALLLLVAGGHGHGIVIGLAGAFAVCLALFAWALPRLPHWLATRDAGRRQKGYGPRFLRVVEGAREDLARDPWLRARAGFLHAALIACDALTLWVLARAVGAAVAPEDAFAAYMVAAVFRTLGFLPGGLGTFEAAAVVMLRLVGVPLGAALSATLLFRGASFWLPMLPGYLCARWARNRSLVPPVAST
jgi:Mg2+-importing ATPase